MSLSYQEIKFVVDELRRILFSGEEESAFVSIQKVYERDANTVVFQLRANQESYFLLFSSTDRHTRVYLNPGKPKQPKSPTAFTMALRKHAIGPLIDIQLSSKDRVVSMDFGDTTFIAELSNIHASLVLVNKESVVISASKFGKRIRPGLPYVERESQSQQTRFPQLSEGIAFSNVEELAVHYESQVDMDDIQKVRTTLNQGIKRKRKHLVKIITKLEDELQKSEDSEGLQKWGTLLQSKIGQIDRGTTEVEVVDYYDENLPKIKIPIDPKKSLQENIERFFHQYRRLNTASDRILMRLDKIESELKVVDGLKEEVEQSETLDKLEALLAKAKRKKIIKAKQALRQVKAKEIRLPYRVYRAASGVEIWVGRNSKGNDILSLKLARGNDVWLHARDWPGSHVLLRTTLKNLKSEDLIDAAMLALHFSKGKNDSGAEITYTSAKHIKKPKGAPPGLVSVASGKSIAIRHDEERIEKILATLVE